MASHLACISKSRYNEAIFSLPNAFINPIYLEQFNKEYKADWESTYFLRLTHQERGLEVQ